MAISHYSLFHEMRTILQEIHETFIYSSLLAVDLRSHMGLLTDIINNEPMEALQ